MPLPCGICLGIVIRVGADHIVVTRESEESGEPREPREFEESGEPEQLNQHDVPKQVIRIFWTFQLVAIALFLFLTGCDFVGQDDLRDGFRRDMLDSVNDARSNSRNCGSTRFESTGRLRWNNKLAESALRHSQDVALSGKEGHVGSDWTGPQARVRDTGYIFETVGEILATGSRSAKDVMDGFLNSAGHCAVLMGQQYKEAGAAMAGGRVWTIVFASPKN